MPIAVKRSVSLVSLAVLLVALVSLGSTALAHPRAHHKCTPSHCVRKGTPYAAKVSLRVSGDTGLTSNSTSGVDGGCDTGTQRQMFNELDSFDIANIAAHFRHVTVPLASREDLGAAYSKLHVPPTATTAGKSKIHDPGTWRINGYGPSDLGKCDKVDFENAGAIHIGKGTKDTATVTPLYGSDGDLAATGFTVLPNISFAPSDWTDPAGQTNSVYDTFNPEVDSVPQQTPTKEGQFQSGIAGFNLVDDPDYFKHLFKQRSPSGGVATFAKYDDQKDCGHPDNGDSVVTCTLSWHYDWFLTFHFHHVYRTKHAYRK